MNSLFLPDKNRYSSIIKCGDDDDDDDGKTYYLLLMAEHETKVHS
jgi:hypothetical protein